ncbi:hypothetical protein [Streptomyces mirabilis]|uniref:hypothetical protein n=1 Tax=Streptomyces mirabilis TaxID=68239 RepID=UPI0036B58704
MTESLRQRDGDQPLPTEGQENVQDRLLELIKERRALGVQRYGRPLQTFNGRNAPRDLIEELLDGATYAMQVEMEMAALKAERDYLAQSLSDALNRPVDVILKAARAALAKEKEREADAARQVADWAVQATHPVEEVAVHPDSLGPLKDKLDITRAEKRVGGPIDEYFGFPLVTDDSVPRFYIFMRPRQRQV